MRGCSKRGVGPSLVAAQKSFVNFFVFPQIMQCETERRSVSSADGRHLSTNDKNLTHRVELLLKRRRKSTHMYSTNVCVCVDRYKKNHFSVVWCYYYFVVAQNLFAIARLHKTLYNFKIDRVQQTYKHTRKCLARLTDNIQNCLLLLALN